MGADSTKVTCVALLIWINSCQAAQIITNPATFDHTYELSLDVYDIHVFIFSAELPSGKGYRVRLHTALTGQDELSASENPVLVVVKQQNLIQSWTLPLSQYSSSDYGSNEMSRQLCYTDRTIPLAAMVEISTFSFVSRYVTVRAALEYDYTVKTGLDYHVLITPTSPTFYLYAFNETSGHGKSVTLHVHSDERVCAYVAIQEASCPILDMIENIKSARRYQSFLNRTALLINKPTDAESVNIVFVVAPSDEFCTTGPTTTNHSWSDYVLALFLPLLYCLLVGSVLGVLPRILIHRCFRKRVDEPSKGADSDSELPEVRDVSERFLDNEASTDDNNEPDSGTTLTSGYSDPDPGVTREQSASISSGSAGDVRLDLANAENVKDTTEEPNDCVRDQEKYGLENDVTITEVADNTETAPSRKREMYHRILWTVFVFYAIPVFQSAFSYSKNVTEWEEQDLCYHNFRCARQLGVFHNFNSIYSNVGYILFAVFFLAIVGYRHYGLYKQRGCEGDEAGGQLYFGTYYALGWALFIQGVMGSCYYICPNKINFPADVTFVYVIGVLLAAKLYQSHRPHITVRADNAFLCAGLVACTVIVGVALDGSLAFWVLFTLIYILTVLYIGLKIYSRGQVALSDFSGSLQKIKLYLKGCRGCKRRTSLRKSRTWLTAGFVMVNITLAAVWGAYLRGFPLDVPSFLLVILYVNLSLYALFYACVNIKTNGFYTRSCNRDNHPNRKLLLVTVYTALAVISAGLSLSYRSTTSTASWSETPAEWRDRNEPCYLGNFYDERDVWHFLSATAAYFACLAAFYMDSDLHPELQSGAVVSHTDQ